MTLFALTCKGIYIDVDVRHALANIRGIAAMSTVAHNASVAIYQLEMCPDDLSDLCETDAAYILVHTGDSGSLPEPPDGTYDTPDAAPCTDGTRKKIESSKSRLASTGSGMVASV